MSALFDDLNEGLQEAIAYEMGEIPAKAKVFTFSPIQNFDKKEIRQIRIDSKMSRSVFAQYMGVSSKTVEAWECGRTHPTGPARRLLSILQNGKAEELGLISIR